MNNSAILTEMIAQATTELFADYSFPVEYLGAADAPPELPELAGVIGFFGNEVTGTMALATSRKVIDAKAAATPGVVSSTDWLAELANQLLGRLKHLLLAQSATICLGTPVAVSGKDLEFSARPDGQAPTCSLFSSAQGSIMVWLDAQFAEDFEFHPRTDGDDGADAGETIFF